MSSGQRLVTPQMEKALRDKGKTVEAAIVRVRIQPSYLLIDIEEGILAEED